MANDQHGNNLGEVSPGWIWKVVNCSMTLWLIAIRPGRIINRSMVTALSCTCVLQRAWSRTTHWSFFDYFKEKKSQHKATPKPCCYSHSFSLKVNPETFQWHLPIPTLPPRAEVPRALWQRFPGTGKAEEQDFSWRSIAIKFSVIPSPSLLPPWIHQLPSLSLLGLWPMGWGTPMGERKLCWMKNL